jgi:hypothetical protein
MKTQQRTFVVEFKSARRRLTVRPDSIWADTDLKAFVHEAEAEAPHLFESKVILKASGQDCDLQPDSIAETHLNDSAETRNDGQISASLAEAKQSYPPQQENVPTVTSVSELKEDGAEWRSPRASRRQDKARVVYRPSGAKSAATARPRPAAAHVEVPSDELVVLEEENRRLKGLLANRLRQQNLQLREMLERFGGI